VLRSFPYGAAALCLLLLSLASGAYIAGSGSPQQKATLTYWVFNKPNRGMYNRIAAFERENPGVKIDLQLVALSGLAQRLQAAFQADLESGVPDLVSVEISSAGTFFRGPLHSVGFVDLTNRIQHEGLRDRIVQARFAPYTKQGRIFGLPNDVHPVMLAYRRDLMEQAGVDVSKIETWDDFVAAGKKTTVPGRRFMIEMSDTGRDMIEVCLFQRGGGYFDAQGNCIFDNEIGVQTMLWYVPLVAKNSKTRIAGSLSSSYGAIITQAMEDGYFVCLMAPDWRTKFIENDIPRIGGKMALMPLPAIKPGGRRTSTWGGTMIGITKKCKNPELAWKFAKYLNLNPDDLAARFAETNMLPPLKDAWNDPVFDTPRPYWSNQPLGRLYADLAPDVPPQYTSPFIVTAKGKLSEALVASVERYNQHGESGFEPFVRARLKRSADAIRKLMARSPYE
jgi:arabinosaccharide transport system substrate-binding protein